MDVVLELLDDWMLDRAYAYVLPYPPQPSSLFSSHNTTDIPKSYSTSSTYHPSLTPTSLLPRDSILRQCISLYLFASIGAAILYFVFCSISYYFVFDRRLEHHPRFLKNQIRMEIASSMNAIPWIDLLTVPWFLGELRGYSKLYENVDEYGWLYLFTSVALFLGFTDFAIYWIHRLEHHPNIYKHVHKPHHKWISKSIPLTRVDHQLMFFSPVPTPWAALAFHPIDGYAQSLPYQ